MTRKKGLGKRLVSIPNIEASIEALERVEALPDATINLVGTFSAEYEVQAQRATQRAERLRQYIKKVQDEGGEPSEALIQELVRAGHNASALNRTYVLSRLREIHETGE